MTGEIRGIICINKPCGFTSFDVIAKMRGILKMRRLGHGGTLDPMAEGVLPVFAGTATKACEMLPDHDKVYRAGFKLGITTDTHDITGNITAENKLPVTHSELEEAAEGFKGEIMQTPPMYSAVSVGGKRLYEYAREGKEIEREPRKITVYSLDIVSFDAKTGEGIMEISCSKGTYIRTLINDIGDRLSCGGVMTSLVRTAACGFSLKDCVTLEELQREAEGERDFNKYVLPLERVFSYLPKINLADAQERMYKNGVRLDFKRLRTTDSSAAEFAVFGSDGAFLGIAEKISGAEGGELLASRKNFY